MKRICCSVLVVALAAAAAVHADGFEPHERELVVRTAYETLARSIASSGTAVGFEISDIKTIPAARFDRFRWTEVVTLPGGDMVDVTRQAATDPTGWTKVSYKPEWRLGAAAYLASPEGELVAGMTIQEFLARVAEDQPDAARAKALTSYQVTVRLGGRSRPYRAAALWLPYKAGSSRVFFADHITQGVEEALREKPAPPRPSRVVDPLTYVTAATTVCQQTSEFMKQMQQSSGYEGHPVSGRHWSKAEVEFACHCSSDCRSTCQSAFTIMECDDEGPTDLFLCHVTPDNSQTGSAVEPYGLEQGAECGAGYGCIERACFGCLCNLGISVNITNGVSVSFSVSGDPDWNHGNFIFGNRCPKCQEAPPPPIFDPDDPDVQQVPSDPGGGGGGGGCRSTCWSWMSNGTYYMWCDLIC